MERFGLQGFQCKFFGSMNKTEMLAATGNCMTVPVVGAALSAVFRHVSQAARCSPWLSLPLDLSACWRRSESFIFGFRKIGFVLQEADPFISFYMA